MFLFGPFTIYQGNAQNFSTSLTTILLYLTVPCIIFGLVLTVIGVCLPEKLHQRYISIVGILGILVWAQGNLLVWEYGALDGKSIDWAQGVWRGWIDGSVWAGLLILAFMAFKKIYRIIPVASIVLFFLQCVFVGLTSMQQPQIWEKAPFLTSPQKIFEFSTQQNVIHIILDCFQADIFQTILDQEPHYSSALQGFTFFKETTGAAPKTFLSIPALLSGQNYKNDIRMREFADYIYKEKAYPNVLLDQGYSIDLVVERKMALKDRSANVYSIPRPYISETQQPYGPPTVAFMLDLVLFRSVPHVFKKFIYNDQKWLVFRKLFKDIPEYMETSYFSEIAFMQDLIDHAVVMRNTPTYKFIHFMATHPPYIVDCGCEYAGAVLEPDRESTTVQSRCFLKHLLDFINKLKSLGIYDSSLIIINGDHGTLWTLAQGQNMDVPLEGDVDDGLIFPNILANVNPLLLVKPPYQKGTMSISSAQTQLTDIPATVSAMLNLKAPFPGQSVFTVTSSEIRARKYYYSKEYWQGNYVKEYFDLLEEYVIQGPHLDKSSWRLEATYYSPKGQKEGN